jgi:hypothetical protein
MPWRPGDWEGDDPCWKLIAGVIELPEPSQPKITADTDEDDLPF